MRPEYDFSQATPNPYSKRCVNQAGLVNHTIQRPITSDGVTTPLVTDECGGGKPAKRRKHGVVDRLLGQLLCLPMRWIWRLLKQALQRLWR
ncbi:MAG: hypothetical protein LRY53_11620 [Burkholderiaceae bacterium]|nr:hypothetical protein [Burkholderiaceae bacterium]